MPQFPEWWKWDLSFTGHAEIRIVIVEPDAEAKLLVVVTVYEVSA